MKAYGKHPGHYFPVWVRLLLIFAPGLFKKCPAGFHHWFRDKYCYCRCGDITGDWDGGIYEFETGKEIFNADCHRSSDDSRADYLFCRIRIDKMELLDKTEEIERAELKLANLRLKLGKEDQKRLIHQEIL